MLLLLSAMIHQGGVPRIAAFVFIGFCLLALYAVIH
jgi:hypothetical protein